MYLLAFGDFCRTISDANVLAKCLPCLEVGSVAGEDPVTDIDANLYAHALLGHTLPTPRLG